jgi:hypothetical protein
MDAVTVSSLVVGAVLIAVFSVSLAGRFSGEGTQASDDIRGEQIHRLAAEIAEHPLLGKGLGASAGSYKRSETIPFSYEVQWYAMTMQLGAVGLMWFLIHLVSAMAKGVRSARGAALFLSVFLLWLVGGFTNPLVVSLGSAFGLVLLVWTMESDEARARCSSATAPRTAMA